MVKFFPYLVLLILISPNMSWAMPPKTFSASKRLAGKLFSQHPITLYCHCRYNKKTKKIDLKSCGMQAAQTKKRAHSLEWEHMVPVSMYIKHYACGREKLCVKKNGKRYGGRKCCEKIDKEFRQAEAELYNLWPSVGLVNGTRRDYKYAMLTPKPPFYGCAVTVDKSSRRFEPSGQAKGIVARASLFMSKKYHIRLSSSQKKMFAAWDKEYPPHKQ